MSEQHHLDTSNSPGATTTSNETKTNTMLLLPTSNKQIDTINTNENDNNNDENVSDTSDMQEVVNIPMNATVLSLFIDDVPPIFQIGNDQRPHIRVCVNGVSRLPLLDTGSMICVIGYADARELDCYQAQLHKCNSVISTVSHSNQKVDGVMFLRYEIDGNTHEIPTLVLRTRKSQFIVGINFFNAFDIRFVWGKFAGDIPKVPPLGKAEAAEFDRSFELEELLTHHEYWLFLRHICLIVGDRIIVAFAIIGSYHI